MTTEKIAVAIRVLKAMSARQCPEENDVELLRSYCPDRPTLDPDELASIVIQDFIESQRNVKIMQPVTVVSTSN